MLPPMRPGRSLLTLTLLLAAAGSSLAVAQDPMSDRVERIADLVHQDGERLTIALPGCLDEVSIHLGLR